MTATGFKALNRHVFAVVGVLLLQSVQAENYSPAVGKQYPANVYWGDTHLHSSLSADANAIGNAALSPVDAYRFARGETVVSNSGQQAKLNRPLDFLVIADHAAYIGVLPQERVSGSPQSVLEYARKFFTDIMGGGSVADDRVQNIMRSTWQDSLKATEAAYEPGRFTSLAGFEWSSMPGGDNLHRVVIFRDGADKAGQVQPFSANDSLDPRDLWKYLHQYENATGGKVLAIPHNGNVSNGRMFADTLPSGARLDADYARERARWEPVVEVTQIKGDGEAHPFLSPNDEFADFGTWDKGNLGTTALKQDAMLQYEYARSALKLGLRIEGETGINPFQFGMIGSTDSHTSLATAEEDNFWGKATNYEPSKKRSQGNFMVFKSGGSVTDSVSGDDSTWSSYTPQASDIPVHTWEQLAAGYAAVWATENTREAIFDALQRREVYATTGPRMTVRFFGGWHFLADDVYRPDYVQHAYQRGVPMGAELPAAPRNTSPSFIVTALKDVAGANLDRVQIVKGWLDADGSTLREKVYDVAWSGERKMDRKGRLKAVGSTVDLGSASYRNTIGAAQLATVWTDPDFDPAERAVYYVRVLEIPTPRWIVYDEVRLGSQFPADAKRIHQERAYTSPIWYRPQ